MTKRPNPIDQSIKDVFSSKTFKTFIGSISAFVIIVACFFVCAIGIVIILFASDVASIFI